MITIEGLDLILDGSVVLAGLTASVEPGDYIWLSGSSGAGKTTLLRCLAGLIPATAGKVLIDGAPPGAPRARQVVGYLPDTPLLYDVMTPREHLDFLGRLWGTSDSLDRVVERFRLDEIAGRYARDLSLGQRQRLALAIATFHRPRVLLLDEPFNGLDESTTDLVGKTLQGHRSDGGIVIVATHLTGHTQHNRRLHLQGGHLCEEESAVHG